MSLIPGARLGAYEIIALLGAGGMGEVYRARDTKLAREVALKLVPNHLAGDPERLARFEREAHVLAALNHSNIAHIYGLEDARSDDGTEVRALVMELVEGTTLADRMAAGPVPIGETLAIARQLADALDVAHEKGIIHRDLKPANVMITRDGVVKVLDFGLAAVTDPSGSRDTNASHSPTLTMASRAGVILGTAAYMSPEQAAAKPVDKRADIWSFGVIVWELLVGQRLFNGETVSHILADVLRAEIDFAKLPRDTPNSVRELLRRCLDRETRNRLRDIGEARVVLQKELVSPGRDGAPRAALLPSAANRRAVAAWGVATLAIVSSAVLAFVHFRERPARAEPVRFQILPPPNGAFGHAGVLSPDGRHIAFELLGPDGRLALWVQSLDSVTARPLPGTEGLAPGPFWSPDSRYLAFAVNGFPGRLKKIAAAGGPVQTLCEYAGGFREGAWGGNGVILFGATSDGLFRVPEVGGTTALVTRIDAARREVQHAGPTFLPDGRRFLYHRASGIAANRGIYIGSLDAKPEAQSTNRLLASDSDPVYVAASTTTAGSILFLREGTLLVQSFDGDSALIGEPIPFAEDIGNVGSHGWFSASGTAALTYRTGREAATTNELVWANRQGKRLGQLGPAMNVAGGVHLSPDGKKVAITRAESLTSGAVGSAPGTRVWIADASRGIFSRLNTGEASAAVPAIGPDGRLAFTSTLNGAVGDLYWIPSTGIGSPEPLLLKSPTVKHPNDFSPDGRYLIYDDHTAQRQDLYILPIELPAGAAERKPIPFIVTEADETFGQFSPDGKWIAYSSDESGRREVYVQGFVPDKVPAAGVGKWPISTAGGDKPRWRADGKELFYIGLDRRMMAVPVTLSPNFEPGVAVALFETNVAAFVPYDVSPDGRFLLNTVSASAPPARSPMTVVLNWRSAIPH